MQHTPRETYKDIEISGRNFRIHKMTPDIGGYVCLKVIGMITPIFNSINIKSSDIENIGGILEKINLTQTITSLILELKESDFRMIQSKCLESCSEVLPGNITPVRRSNGTWGAIGIESNAPLALALTMHAIVYNVSDFFVELPSMFKSGGLSSFLPTSRT